MGLSLKTNIVIIAAVFPCLVVLSIAGRFWSRRKKPAPLGIDDYLVVPGGLGAVSLCAVTIAGVYAGNLGEHVVLGPSGQPLDPTGLEAFFKLEFANQLISVVSLTFTKLSIITFYRRVFISSIFNVVSLTAVALVVGWGLAFFFATLFECYPVSQVWTTSFEEPGRKCYNYLPMFYGTAISNLLIDVFLISIPQPLVWKLQMPLAKRFGVSAIFLVGAFVCGISIARIVYFYNASYNDVTYGIAPTLYWTMLEASTAVVCACLPTMRPVFLFIQRVCVDFFQSLRSRGSGSGYSKFGVRSQDLENPLPIRRTCGQNDISVEATGGGTVPLHELPPVVRTGNIGVKTTITTETAQ